MRGGVDIARKSGFGNATSAASPSPQERALRAASEAAPFEPQAALVLVVDPSDVLLHASPGWEQIFGNAAEAVAGRPILDAIPDEALEPIHHDALCVDLSAALRDATLCPIPLLYRHHRNGWRTLEGFAYGTRDGRANTIVIFHDVTSRLRELKSLIESEHRFRMIAEACNDMVTETDASGRFTYVSRACEEVLGYSPHELQGSSPIRIQHPDEVDQFREEVLASVGSEKPFRVTRHRLRRKDGGWVWVEATGVRYRRPDGLERVIGVARDVSARLAADRVRHDLEERVLRAEKLESLGSLAGGIAHDFNNLLTPILGNASLLLADLPEDAPVRRWAQAIRTAAERAAKLTGQMLAYAGQPGRHVTMIDVSTIIRDVSLLLETTASSTSRVYYDLATDLPHVHGDGAQVTQMVMNLVANASDALGDDGGRIIIRTGCLYADRAMLDASHLGEDRPQGDYVTIEVEDDGEGLDRETLQRMLDPFFSTRIKRRGLGLSVVLGTVRAHEGALQIESEEEEGTCFRILLPVAKKHPTQDELRPSSGGAPTVVRRVLVVDDDTGARELTVTSLKRAGFDVVEASNGPEAISLYDRSKNEIDAIVLDGTMPGMSSAHVFDALRKIATDARVILISGYEMESGADALWERGLSGFVHKPYEPDALVREIRRLFGP